MIHDDSSVYVGGLAYDATEESLRKVFNLYGAVVGVKIINDRDVRGKCYGFVTFSNPRSAVDAINDMNGRTIGGRVVRVNEVRTRGGRPNFNREKFHRDAEREIDRDRVRDTEKDHYHERDHYRDRSYDRFRDRDGDYEHGRDHERATEFSLREDHDQERIRNRDRDWESNHDMAQGREIELDKSKESAKDEDKEQQSRKQLGSSYSNNRRVKDFSSLASVEYHDRLKEQLTISTDRLEELQKEIMQIEENLDDKQQVVLDLQRKTQKLEDSLASAKKLCSQRQTLLIKMQKCVLQGQEYGKNLKSCELELKSLVDIAMTEADVGDDADLSL